MKIVLLVLTAGIIWYFASQYMNTGKAKRNVELGQQFLKKMQMSMVWSQLLPDYTEVTSMRLSSIIKRLTRMCLQRVVLLFLLPIIVCGCGSTNQSDVKPGFDDLSGIYRFIDLNGFSADEFPNPLIDFNEIAEPSDVKR